MDPVLVLLALAVVVVLGALFLVSKFQKKEKTEDEDEKKEEDEGEENRPARRTARDRLRAAQLLRSRQRLAGHRAQGGNGNEVEMDMFDAEMPEDERMRMLEEECQRLPEGKIGAKKVLREERKAEKAAMREAEEARRQAKKEKEEDRLAALRQKEEEEKLEEEKRAEEEAKRKEEQEKREQEEFEKWKKTFEVEESGEDAVNEEESQSLLKEFMDFIKEKKVVLLEDLAARFNLKTQDAINRLKDLLAAGEIEGLMDDRGKFIHITKEEYASVSKFISQHGRVSIADLAQASTELLHLNTA